MSSSSKWFRIQVTDLRTGKNKINFRMPVIRADFGMALVSRLTPYGGKNLARSMFLAAMHSRGEVTLVDIDDEDHNEHVVVFTEKMI